jgi:hypothetical protein
MGFGMPNESRQSFDQYANSIAFFWSLAPERVFTQGSIVADELIGASERSPRSGGFHDGSGGDGPAAISCSSRVADRDIQRIPSRSNSSPNSQRLSRNYAKGAPPDG